MSDNSSLSFTLNQAALNAAIAAELPRLLRELDFDYVSGRQPKGLTAQVTVTESLIRQAVLAYARRNVSAHYTHFDIVFKATRGEDGITTTVVASNPFYEAAAEAEVKAPACPIPAQVEAVIEAEEIVVVAIQEGADIGFPAESEEVPAEDSISVAPMAPARTKLFAGLKRPDNSISAE